MHIDPESLQQLPHTTCGPLHKPPYPIKTVGLRPTRENLSGTVNFLPNPIPSQLAAAIASLPKGSMVIVSAEYANHFKPAPQDGNTYMVQDPLRPWVHHITRPDGTHVVLDKRKPPSFPGLTIMPLVRKKYLNGKPKKKAPRYSTKLTVGVPVEAASDEPPVIRLIGIARVIDMIGFQKSFIYEQPDFPEPVRMPGASRRASVRWVEHEILAWIQRLMAKRSTAAAIAKHCGSALPLESHRPQT